MCPVKHFHDNSNYQVISSMFVTFKSLKLDQSNDEDVLCDLHQGFICLLEKHKRLHPTRLSVSFNNHSVDSVGVFTAV